MVCVQSHKPRVSSSTNVHILKPRSYSAHGSRAPCNLLIFLYVPIPRTVYFIVRVFTYIVQIRTHPRHVQVHELVAEVCLSSSAICRTHSYTVSGALTDTLTLYNFFSLSNTRSLIDSILCSVHSLIGKTSRI